MRLSYTNPITGHRVSRDAGVRYLQIDGVVLEVRHYYRSRDVWSIHAYRDHFSTDVALDWVRSGKDIVIADVRRKGLLDQLVRYIDSDEWATKKQSWLDLTAKTTH